MKNKNNEGCRIEVENSSLNSLENTGNKNSHISVKDSKIVNSRTYIVFGIVTVVLAYLGYYFSQS